MMRVLLVFFGIAHLAFDGLASSFSPQPRPRSGPMSFTVQATRIALASHQRTYPGRYTRSFAMDASGGWTLTPRS